MEAAADDPGSAYAVRLGRAGVLHWRNAGRQGRISATGFEQLHAANGDLRRGPRST
ncbi:hypothetical protein [Streptomyces sp. V4I2]|uniref:hypothetical protein n=1 Tax=Streptomyces sp. V4I2 TaxID=3042280 RepID=UPI00278A7346|nr:hypothetical protein [Streptomyces sp. V4I2]MDQ1048666.1 hypothetical protein [Streptomyces sp. V4I2]